MQEAQSRGTKSLQEWASGSSLWPQAYSSLSLRDLQKPRKTNECPDIYDRDDLHSINRIQGKKLGFIREDPWHLKKDRP